MATYLNPTTEETNNAIGVESNYVVNIIEEVIYPIQVRAKSPVLAAREAEAVYGDSDFDPDAELMKVETGHDIYREHIGTEVVARNRRTLSTSLRLDTLIRLFCRERGIDSEDRPTFATERASIALEAYSKLQGDEDTTALVTDLLSDLMHLCEKRGFEFNDLLDTARANYEEERA